jgi:hypothetical protein
MPKLENRRAIQPTGTSLCYRSLKPNRDAQGVLLAEFHTNGGPLTFTSEDHTDLVDAFYWIDQDHSNKIVIFEEFHTELCFGTDVI